ncbi:MAG: hypothetical protein DME26_21220 [Verrucomicrobia bacterium]|nr:MAG: hypothetical protein DME26_21220 [Verrucomicrobiota bacterium]
MQPSYVHFFQIEGEETNDTKVVRIVNNLEEAVTLELPHSTSPVFHTELTAVNPGKEFELRINYVGPISNTTPQGGITIKTSNTNMPVLSVNAYAVPQPALVLMPQQIQLPAGPTKPDYRYPATLRNNSRTPVKLSDPSVNVEGATVQVREPEAGKTFTLTLAFPANFQAQPGQAMELTVKTTHPKYPVLKVPITQAVVPVVVPAIPPSGVK